MKSDSTPSSPSLESAASQTAGRRLVIACGGTGGHLFPGIAVAAEWRARGGETLLIISEKQIDSLAAEGFEHLRFERQKAIAMPKIASPRMLGFLGNFGAALWQCHRLLGRFDADAVLGMGGFTSTAPLVAGKVRGLPTFIHESNAIPGRANRLNARFSRAVLVGFEACAAHFPGRRTVVAGTPLRPKIAARPERAEGLAFFGLDPARRTLLVMGGSQGARRVNELVVEALPVLARDASLQVLHITGPADYDWVAPAFDASGVAGKALPFCPEMHFAYAAADLAICRSGASSLTELSRFGLPSVLIPYPFAADDHQTRNAEIFSIPGAAELWPQGELEGEAFTARLTTLLADRERLDRMSEAMSALAVPDASGRICDTVAAAIVGG